MLVDNSLVNSSRIHANNRADWAICNLEPAKSYFQVLVTKQDFGLTNIQEQGAYWKTLCLSRRSKGRQFGICSSGSGELGGQGRLLVVDLLLTVFKC